MARKSVTAPAEEKTSTAVETVAEKTVSEKPAEQKTEGIIAKKPRQPEMEEPTTERYRLKALMNVRKRPALDATILGTRAEGTVVRVLKVDGDWLCLADGSFILYEGGKWAEKI